MRKAASWIYKRWPSIPALMSTSFSNIYFSRTLCLNRVNHLNYLRQRRIRSPVLSDAHDVSGGERREEELGLLSGRMSVIDGLSRLPYSIATAYLPADVGLALGCHDGDVIGTELKVINYQRICFWNIHRSQKKTSSFDWNDEPSRLCEDLHMNLSLLLSSIDRSTIALLLPLHSSRDIIKVSEPNEQAVQDFLNITD